MRRDSSLPGTGHPLCRSRRIESPVFGPVPKHDDQQNAGLTGDSATLLRRGLSRHCGRDCPRPATRHHSVGMPDLHHRKPAHHPALCLLISTNFLVTNPLVFTQTSHKKNRFTFDHSVPLWADYSRIFLQYHCLTSPNDYLDGRSRYRLEYTPQLVGGGADNGARCCDSIGSVQSVYHQRHRRGQIGGE